MALGSQRTTGNRTLQITSNTGLFETRCRIWHSFNFVGDVQSIHFHAGKSLFTFFTSTTPDKQLYSHTRLTLFLVLNTTCYKRQKSVKLIHLHNWQLWKENAGSVAAKQAARCPRLTHPCYWATLTIVFAVLCLLCKPGPTLHHFEDFLSLGAQLCPQAKAPSSTGDTSPGDLQWPNPWGCAAPRIPICLYAKYFHWGSPHCHSTTQTPVQQFCHF